MIRAFGISGAGNNYLPLVEPRKQIGLHFHHEAEEDISRGSGASSPVSTKIQSLVIKLGDDNSNVRKQSVDILVKIAKETPEEIVQRLREALKDPDERVRVNASYLLAKISEVSAGELIPAIPELREALKDPNEKVRGNALIVLGSISKVSPDELILAVPELRGALKDPDKRVRVNAAFVILLLSRGLSQNKLYKE